MDYKLTDEQIGDALGFPFACTHYQEEYRKLADTASKKARNQTLKEVKDWLDACGFYVCSKDEKGDFLQYLNLLNLFAYYPPEDKPNRFFPKEAS